MSAHSSCLILSSWAKESILSQCQQKQQRQRSSCSSHPSAAAPYVSEVIDAGPGRVLRQSRGWSRGPECPCGKAPRKTGLDKEKVPSRQRCFSLLLGKPPATALNLREPSQSSHFPDSSRGFWHLEKRAGGRAGRHLFLGRFLAQ